MVLKTLFVAVVGAMLLTCNGLAVADEPRASQYSGDQFLGLDLSQAVLSPKRLGPTTQFQPFPVEANTEPEASPATKSASRVVIPKVKVARGETRHRVKQAKLAVSHAALSHGNPLDAQASDTRIQVWPCRSGGICNWQR